MYSPISTQAPCKKTTLDNDAQCGPVSAGPPKPLKTCATMLQFARQKAEEYQLEMEKLEKDKLKKEICLEYLKANSNDFPYGGQNGLAYDIWNDAPLWHAARRHRLRDTTVPPPPDLATGNALVRSSLWMRDIDTVFDPVAPNAALPPLLEEKDMSDAELTPSPQAQPRSRGKTT